MTNMRLHVHTGRSVHLFAYEISHEQPYLFLANDKGDTCIRAV